MVPPGSLFFEMDLPCLECNNGHEALFGDVEMTIEQLRKHYNSRPFVPFRIFIADGRHLDVKHPEFLAITPGGRTIIVVDSEHTAEAVDLLLVTSLKPIKNSSRRKRK